jgi:hypothetical protein
MSLACTVIVEVLIPSAVMEAGLALIVVLAALNTPLNVTEAGWPMSVAAMVPVMLAVPGMAAEVNIAV